MENSPERPQHQVVQLTPMEMHGPIEVIIAVYVMLPDKRVATLNFRQLAGQIPTRSEIKATMDACLVSDAEDGAALPKGTRLLTKAEFVAHYTKKETGQALTMPGEQRFMPSASEIPKDILINALHGAGGPNDHALEADYIQRGLGDRYSSRADADWAWNHDTLEALPDDILLAIYRRCA